MWLDAFARLALRMPPGLPSPARGSAAARQAQGWRGRGPNPQREYKLLWL